MITKEANFFYNNIINDWVVSDEKIYIIVFNIYKLTHYSVSKYDCVEDDPNYGDFIFYFFYNSYWNKNYQYKKIWMGKIKYYRDALLLRFFNDKYCIKSLISCGVLVLE